jgi:hypothetical protein
MLSAAFTHHGLLLLLGAEPSANPSPTKVVLSEWTRLRLLRELPPSLCELWRDKTARQARVESLRRLSGSSSHLSQRA